MEPRPTCPECQRPVATCLCAHLVSVETRTRVVFLQHPREHGNAIGTAEIAARCLPNSTLHVGVEFDGDAKIRAQLTDPARPAAVLFPGPGARDVRADPPEGPVTLVVIDGTWAHAGKIMRANPWLRSLPRYAFTPTRPSDYRIRREPADHCVSTIEAVAEVLALLEGDGAGPERLLAPFRAMVDRQIEFATNNTGTRSRHWKDKREPRPRPVPDVLMDAPDSVVIAYGEANAYAFDMPGKPPPEIAHWVAVRLGTGERFEAFVRPKHAMCPSLPVHAQLPANAIEEGETLEAFGARWKKFLREGDVLCTWGPYAKDVLAAQGIDHPSHLDLRVATSSYLGTRTGPVDDCARALTGETGTPVFAGRAGKRHAAILTVVEALRRRVPRPAVASVPGEASLSGGSGA